MIISSLENISTHYAISFSPSLKFNIPTLWATSSPLLGYLLCTAILHCFHKLLTSEKVSHSWGPLLPSWNTWNALKWVSRGFQESICATWFTLVKRDFLLYKLGLYPFSHFLSFSALHTFLRIDQEKKSGHQELSSCFKHIKHRASSQKVKRILFWKYLITSYESFSLSRLPSSEPSLLHNYLDMTQPSSSCGGGGGGHHRCRHVVVVVVVVIVVVLLLLLCCCCGGHVVVVMWW